MSLLTVLSVAGAVAKVAHAYSAEDVQYAYDVLNNIPENMASPYCSSYVAPGLTVTETSTEAQYTTTTTLGCNEIPSGYPGYGKPQKTNDAPYPGITNAPLDPNDPIDWFVTSTTTTTITVTTYSTTTIYPDGVIATADNTPFMPTPIVIASPTDSSLVLPTGAVDPYADIYNGPLDVPEGGLGDFNYPQARDAAPFKSLKRSAKFGSVFKRQTWCSDINKPCRLALYDTPSISDACVRYLGGGGAPVTVTTTIYAAVATETSKFCTPGSGSGPIQTGAPWPGYEGEVGGEGYGEEGFGEEDEGYGEEEGDYEGEESYGEDSESYGEEGEDESYGEEGEDYESPDAESEYGAEEGGESESYGEESGKPSHGKPSHSKPSHGGHGGKPSSAYDSEYPEPTGYEHEEGSYGTYGESSSTPSWGEGYPTATDAAYGASTPAWGEGYPVATDSAYGASTPSFGEGYPTATDSAYGAGESGKPEGEHGGEHGGPGGEHGPPGGQHGPPGGQHGPPGGQHGPPGQGEEGKPEGQGPPEKGGEKYVGPSPPAGYCLVKKPKEEKAW